jgi:hypothetical protein
MAKDSLARGARSANFGSLSHISSERWEAIWAEEPPFVIDTQKEKTEDKVNVKSSN